MVHKIRHHHEGTIIEEGLVVEKARCPFQDHHAATRAEFADIFSKPEERRLRKLLKNVDEDALDPTLLNYDVPGFKQLEAERRLLLQTLEQIHDKTQQPPLRLIEHEGCFTNASLLAVLRKILKGKSPGKRLLKVHTVADQDESTIPSELSTNAIYILGGSLGSTFQPFGMKFVRRFSLPLLRQIDRRDDTFAVGICFGHQSLLDAYGMLHSDSRRLWTQTRESEYLFLPVNVLRGHPGLDRLAFPFPRGMVITHSGYPSVLEGATADHLIRQRSDFQPLIRRLDDPVYDVSDDEHEDIRISDKTRYWQGRYDADMPLGGSYLQGKVLSTQVHPEIDPGDWGSIGQVIDYCRRQVPEQLPALLDSLGVRATDPRQVLRQSGVAAAFFIPILKHYAERVLRSL